MIKKLFICFASKPRVRPINSKHNNFRWYIFAGLHSSLISTGFLQITQPRHKIFFSQHIFLNQISIPGSLVFIPAPYFFVCQLGQIWQLSSNRLCQHWQDYKQRHKPFLKYQKITKIQNKSLTAVYNNYTYINWNKCNYYKDSSLSLAQLFFIKVTSKSYWQILDRLVVSDNH